MEQIITKINDNKNRKIIGRRFGKISKT